MRDALITRLCDVILTCCILDIRCVTVRPLDYLPLYYHLCSQLYGSHGRCMISLMEPDGCQPRFFITTLELNLFARLLMPLL